MSRAARRGPRLRRCTWTRRSADTQASNARQLAIAASAMPLPSDSMPRRARRPERPTATDISSIIGRFGMLGVWRRRRCRDRRWVFQARPAIARPCHAQRQLALRAADVADQDEHRRSLLRSPPATCSSSPGRSIGGPLAWPRFDEAPGCRLRRRAPGAASSAIWTVVEVDEERPPARAPWRTTPRRRLPGSSGQQAAEWLLLQPQLDSRFDLAWVEVDFECAKGTPFTVRCN